MKDDVTSEYIYQRTHIEPMMAAMARQNENKMSFKGHIKKRINSKMEQILAGLKLQIKD